MLATGIIFCEIQQIPCLCIWWRTSRPACLPHSAVLFVERCGSDGAATIRLHLWSEALSRAQEVKWPLSSYQSTVHSFKQPPSGPQVPTEWATAANKGLFGKITEKPRQPLYATKDISHSCFLLLFCVLNNRWSTAFLPAFIQHECQVVPAPHSKQGDVLSLRFSLWDTY